MGYVGDKILLIIFHISEVGCHEVQRCGQIANLILCVHRNLVVQITGSKLSRSLGYAAELRIDGKNGSSS